MTEAIKGLNKASGFLMAIASVMADREMCGDQRDSFLMQEARYLASRVDVGADYIIHAEKEIDALRDKLAYLEKVSPWICPKCHERLLSAWRFCPGCGNTIDWDSVGREAKDEDD